jgi:hypothetical protein
MGLMALVATTNAQLSCNDPFKGAGTLRFPTEFWRRTDFCQHSVPFSEIRSGGVAPDGIPPIDAPQFETIAAAREWLLDPSPVIALEVDGEARAYPLAILIWHEIVNDEIGGLPVAVTFCPLCNSSIVFERRVGDDVLRFGVSGNLRNSDLIMWDDATQSWWQQVTGEAIVGDYTGTQLQIVPSLVTGFGAFAAQYPGGQVLSRETGFGRGYGRNPYVGYDSEPQPFLFEGELDPRLPATAHILAGVVNGVAVAYPFSALAEAGVINDTVGETPVVALWQPGAVSALDASSIDQSRDVGMAALYSRVLNNQTLTFIVEDGQIRDEQTGSVWNVFGVAVAGELSGSQLETQRAAPHFWFAWAAFRPDTVLYGSP